VDFPHLAEVCLARDSRQVAQKDEQERLAAEIAQAHRPAVRLEEREVAGLFANSHIASGIKIRLAFALDMLR
jgi:hypothetical protein